MPMKLSTNDGEINEFSVVFKPTSADGGATGEGFTLFIVGKF